MESRSLDLTLRQIFLTVVPSFVVVGAAFWLARIPEVQEKVRHDLRPLQEVSADIATHKSPDGIPMAPYKQPEFQYIERLAKDREIEDAESLHYIYYTTAFTVWATLILLSAAMCLYFLHLSNPSLRNYWILLWTFAWIAYCIHVGWAAVVAFDKAGIGKDRNGKDRTVFNSKTETETKREIVVQQGRVEKAVPNSILLVVWGVDVILSWFVGRVAVWRRFVRPIVHVAVFAVAFGASVTQAKASSEAGLLGILMALSVALCVAVAVTQRRDSAPSEVT